LVQGEAKGKYSVLTVVNMANTKSSCNYFFITLLLAWYGFFVNDQNHIEIFTNLDYLIHECKDLYMVLKISFHSCFENLELIHVHCMWT